MKTLRILALLLPLLLIGCATGITVQVDSITGESGPASGTRYYLKSGMANTAEHDLYFAEFSRYFHLALADKGYQRAATPGEADLLISFSYGVSDAITTKQIYSTPIYDWVGGDTITYEETKTDAGGTTTTTSKIYVPARHQMVGREVHVSKYTTFTSYALLVAERAGAASQPPLWKLSVQGSADTSDLRSVMPALAAAAAPHLSTNTGKAIKIRITENDPRVIQLRNRAGH